MAINHLLVMGWSSKYGNPTTKGPIWNSEAEANLVLSSTSLAQNDPIEARFLVRPWWPGGSAASWKNHKGKASKNTAHPAMVSTPKRQGLRQFFQNGQNGVD